MENKDLTIEEFQKFVVDSWHCTKKKRLTRQDILMLLMKKRSKGYGMRDDFIMCTGLGGETGEVLEVLKKNERDGKMNKDDLVLELGDVLYYLLMIAERHGITAQQIMRGNVGKLEGRHKSFHRQLKKFAKLELLLPSRSRSPLIMEHLVATPRRKR
jgi:NTP pyrophosphatase (non-canonical NTP hydrolase)